MYGPRFICVVILFCLLLFLSVQCKHHGSSHHGSGGGGGDEMLPAVCANGETMSRSKHEADIASFENCKYQRLDAIAWMDKGFDMNGDGSLDMHECIQARKYYLKWWERPVAESCDTVFLHCDCDGDGLITQEDFERAVFTCLRNCETVMTIDKYIASRMKDGLAYNGKIEE